MDEVIGDNNDGYFKLRVSRVFCGGNVLDVRNCYLWEFCYHFLWLWPLSIWVIGRWVDEMWVVGFVWEFEYVVEGGVWWVMNMWMRIDVSCMREEEVMEVCWDGYVDSLLRRYISMLDDEIWDLKEMIVMEMVEIV